ncbi:MAG TPA: MBL fold metallo-hydrolase [Candidatus Cloacimonadota bacterium]|nr:MBL fold metallo-hydrolase [Candidatus Cloacimonadota bacterium]
MKNFKWIILFLPMLILSCGKNEKLVEPAFQEASGLFNELYVENNTLIVETKADLNIRFEYFKRFGGSEKYYGWSAKGKDSEFSFHLPLNSSNSQYLMKIRVENEDVYQDTVIYFTATPDNYSFLEMHFIDVKQGDANYIKTPDNKHLMIDGGYGTRGNSNLNWQGYGQPLALNYMLAQNVNHFDYLIETHHDADHYGGISDIKNSGQFTWTYDLSNSNTYNYQEGQTLDLDSPVQFRILNIGYPPGEEDSGDNNSSIVLMVNYGYADILLTGDAEGVVQTYMMLNPWSLSADMLKISHHGSSSNGTSSNDFLETVFNQYSKIGILSFGTNNTYGHPHSLYRFANYTIFGTGNPTNPSPYPNHYFNCGTIKTFTDGQGIVVKYNQSSK